LHALPEPGAQGSQRLRLDVPPEHRPGDRRQRQILRSNAWQCWRINRDLGGLDAAKYCAAAGHGTSKLVANNADGWYCTSPWAPVETTAACDTLYHVSNAVSRFAVFASPYFWQCWN